MPFVSSFQKEIQPMGLAFKPRYLLKCSVDMFAGERAETC